VLITTNITIIVANTMIKLIAFLSVKYSILSACDIDVIGEEYLDAAEAVGLNSDGSSISSVGASTLAGSFSPLIEQAFPVNFDILIVQKRVM
jgi:hypothetical protein